MKPWLASIRTRLLLAYGAIILAGFAVLTLLAAGQISAAADQLSTTMQGQQVQHLKDELALIGQQLGDAADGASLERMSAEQLDGLMQRFSGQVDGTLTLFLPSDPRPGAATLRGQDDFASMPEMGAALGGQVGVAERKNEAGIETIYVGSPVVYNGAPVVGLLQLAVPAASVETMVRQRWVTLGLAFLVLLCLSIGAAVWLGRSITRPLFRLRDSALRLAHGDLAYRVPNPGSDEVGDVARAFNQMAGEVEKMLEEQRAFARNAAHELRTPLTAMRLRTEALRYESLDRETAERYVAELDDELVRMGDLVEDLSLLSRFDAGRAELASEEIDLNRLAAGLCSQIEPLASAKGVALSITSAGQPVPVCAGLSHLTVVFRNLLDNALKFTPAGGQIAWEISLSEDGVLSCIADTGQGIPAADLPHVFERFYRGDKSRSRTVPGTGLGLALVRSIVTAYGGRVEIASPGPGQGACVNVWWPCRKPAASGCPPLRRPPA